MNICIFVKDFAAGDKFSKDGMPIKSGAEFHAENHAQQLIKRGHRVSIFAKKRLFSTTSRENINGIDLVRLHGGFRWLEIFLRLLTTHRDIDAFYIIGTPKFAIWAIKFAKFFHKPVTLALTINEEIFSNNSWRSRIFQYCDHFVAISHEIERGLIAKGNIDISRIKVIPQGIDVQKFSESTEELRRQLKQKFGIDPDSKVLLFLARLSLRKGTDILQKIWLKLHPKFPTAKFLVVGGGFNEILDQFRDLSKKLNDSIIVVGEIDEPKIFYQMSDVYVFPSRGEGLPTSLMEAMSCGLPSVVSKIGGNEDLIFDYQNGFIVETENVDSYVAKISELFENDELRLKLGCGATKFAHENCDYVKVISKLEEVITDENFARN